MNCPYQANTMIADRRLADYPPIAKGTYIDPKHITVTLGDHFLPG